MPRSPKQIAAWEHNGLAGATEFAKQAMNRIMCAPTASHEAKVKASEIHVELLQLRQLLKQRIDKP
jgi:hypothetical protein